MKTQSIRNFYVMSLSALLISSLLVVVSMSSAQSAAGSDEVSAASGSNRFVVWADSTPGNYDIFLRRSTDNGATWQAIKNLSNNPGNSGSPDIAVSGSNVYVVWLQENADHTQRDIFARRSTDNGATWKAVVKITSIGTVGHSTPQVIGSGSNVYVVWDQDNGEIYFRRSMDNGATWKSIFNLSSNPGTSTRERIEVSGSNVYVIWYQGSEDETKSDIFFRRSTDSGATWKSKINLSKFGQIDSYPDIAVSGSNVHVVWNQRDPTSDFGYTQVFIRSSMNNGATWDTAENLTTPTTDFANPHVDTSGSNVYVLYEKVLETGDHEYFTDLEILPSRDHGSTWEPALVVAENVQNFNTFPDPKLLALGSNVYVAWVDGSQSEGDLHFRGSTDNGVNWGPISGDLNNQRRIPRDLHIAATGSSVFLVWEMNYPSEIYLRRSVDNGDAWQSAKNLSNSVSGISVDPDFAS